MSNQLKHKDDQSRMTSVEGDKDKLSRRSVQKMRLASLTADEADVLSL